jgi:hypothetical protein
MIDTDTKEMADDYSKEALFASLRCKLMEKNNLTSNAVNTYTDTIIYKLTNTTPTIHDDGSTVEAS